MTFEDVDAQKEKAEMAGIDHIVKFGINKPPPEITTDDEKVEWSAARLKQLAPRATQEIDYLLHYGTEKVRKELAIEILKVNGLASEKSNRAVAPIIVINATNVQALPWTAKKKLVADGAVVEAQLKELAGDNEKK